jgi:hypothetical protein
MATMRDCIGLVAGALTGLVAGFLAGDLLSPLGMSYFAGMGRNETDLWFPHIAGWTGAVAGAGIGGIAGLLSAIRRRPSDP